MPDKPQRGQYESKVACWLRETGFSKADIAQTLKVNLERISEHLQHPDRYFTVQQMWLIAGMCQHPFIEVLYACINHRHRHIQNEIDETIEDMTGIGIKTIDEPESETE